MTSQSEQSPNPKYLVLGELNDNFYIGFRSTETNKFAGIAIAELVELGLDNENVDGVALDNNKDVVAVRIHKSELETDSEHATPHSQFEFSFAVDVASKHGAFVCPRGIEQLTDRADKVFMSLLGANADASIEKMWKELDDQS